MIYLILTALLMAAPKPHPVRRQDEAPKHPTWEATCHTVWDMESEPVCKLRQA